ncbi:MAG TPA: agmatinase [Candidatus Hydrogenedentes bacterium]|nr:agmatinase [Candidatus Hydrogenedentota bacterium]
MYRFLSEDERFLALADAAADPQRAGCVIVPVPFEKTSSYGTGSRAGPAAILDASRQVEVFDAALGLEPHTLAGGIATLRPLEVDDCDGPGVAERLERVVQDWRDAGKRVVTLGGEHTSVVGAIKAHVQGAADVTLLQLDAHSDLRPEYDGDAWSHACAMARVLDFHAGIVQVGVRGQAQEERAIAEQHGLRVFYAEDLRGDERMAAHWINDVLEAVAPRVYVSLDCDVLDPSIMPATGTPEPGGLTWRQIDALLRRLCACTELLGFDVSELAPAPGLIHPQFTIAKLVYRLIGHMFAGDLLSV